MTADSAHETDAVETVRQWVNSARFDEELIELEAQTLRAMLAAHDAAVADAKQLRAQGTEYGIRADFTDTTSAEFTIADNLGDALEALAEFDAKHGNKVVSRELVQRPVGGWRKVDDHG